MILLYSRRFHQAVTVGELSLAWERIPRNVKTIYTIETKGAAPTGIPATKSTTKAPGAQYGANFIVPPNPFGGGGDYFPVLAAPGERVTVQTRAQQNQARTEPRREAGGDTYVYNTNVYNPLAAAMLADQQRRERVARSNARMGVA